MPRAAGAKKKTRFTLWLPDDIMRELTRHQEASGKGSVAEVVREAIEVYRSLLRARDEGVKLSFEDEKTGEKGRVWILPGPLNVSRAKR